LNGNVIWLLKQVAFAADSGRKSARSMTIQ